MFSQPVPASEIAELLVPQTNRRQADEYLLTAWKPAADFVSERRDLVVSKYSQNRGLFLEKKLCGL
ncbi:MAG: hypothetical protein WBW81_11115 [Methylocella sp.]